MSEDIYNKLTGSTVRGWSDLVGILFQPPSELEEDVFSKELFPVTKELIYNYDFGDNWIVRITKYKDCEDLLKQNIVGEYELEEAKDTVLGRHRPVCSNKEGVPVLDDVGGLGGFADFLGIIYEGEDKNERADIRTCARSLGWSDKKGPNKKML